MQAQDRGTTVPVVAFSLSSGGYERDPCTSGSFLTTVRGIAFVPQGSHRALSITIVPLFSVRRLINISQRSEAMTECGNMPGGWIKQAA